MAGEPNRRVLAVTPHPDDDALGAPATLRFLDKAGFDVTIFACSLGQPDQVDRRRAELRAACKFTGYDLHIPDQTTPDLSDDADDRAERALAAALHDYLEQNGCSVVVSPHVHDAHPTHELVARATKYALEQASPDDHPVRWWQWGLWSELLIPTCYLPFGEAELDFAKRQLAVYVGELERNNYERFLVGRSIARAPWGAEAVFGFGASKASELPYAETLTEVEWRDGRWRIGTPRTLRTCDDVFAATTDIAVDSLLASESLRSQLRHAMTALGSPRATIR